MKRSIIALTLLLSVACEGTRLRTNNVPLDPDVAAEVKRINMERYAGSWLKTNENSFAYIELDASGYYTQIEDKDGTIQSADRGTLEHYLPGLMIMKTTRPECEEDKIVFLKMDQVDGKVRLRSTKDKDYSAALVATAKRSRPDTDTAACMPSN